MSDLAISPLGP